MHSQSCPSGSVGGRGLSASRSLCWQCRPCCPQAQPPRHSCRTTVFLCAPVELRLKAHFCRCFRWPQSTTVICMDGSEPRSPAEVAIAARLQVRSSLASCACQQLLCCSNRSGASHSLIFTAVASGKRAGLSARPRNPASHLGHSLGSLLWLSLHSRDPSGARGLGGKGQGRGLLG